MEDRNKIHRIKGIALYLIVGVHSCAIGINSGCIAQGSLRVLATIGSIGVPVFFFISGYLYNTEYSMKTLIYKKIHRILLPWIISAIYLWITMTYIFHSSSNSLLQSFIGSNTPLWYLAVLVFFYIWFYFLKSYRGIYFSIVLSLVIHIISVYIPQAREYMAVNMNAFNWMIFFAMGLLGRKWKWTLEIKGHYLAILALLYCVGGVGFWVLKSGKIVDYYEPLGYVNQMMGILVTIGVASKIKEGRFLEKVGMYSYSIYLFHLPIAMILNYGFVKKDIFNSLLLLRPICCIIITYILIYIAEWFIKKYFKSNRLLLAAIGR